MTRIGNDIVNFNDSAAAGKSGNARFLSRAFTPSERGLIGSDADVWALWAAKESAYKVVSKGTGSVSASPLRYEVLTDAVGHGGNTAFHCGTVWTPCGPVFFRLAYGPGYIHCIGADRESDLDAVRWGVEYVGSGNPMDESLLVRRAAASRIAEYLEANPSEVEIRGIPNARGGRVPAAFLRGEAIPGDLSLSHDFPYVAYAFFSLSDGAGPGRSWPSRHRPFRVSPLSGESRLQTSRSFLR